MFLNSLFANRLLGNANSCSRELMLGYFANGVCDFKLGWIERLIYDEIFQYLCPVGQVVSKIEF